MATLVRGEAVAKRDRVASEFDELLLDEPGNAGASASLDARHLLASVRANALLIAAILIGALITAVVLTMLATPHYTAQATVQINSQADQVLANDEDGEQARLNAWDQDRFLQTQLDILESRGLSQRVAQRLKLQGNPAFLKAMDIKPDPDELSGARAEKLTLAALRGSLATELPRNSRIVAVRFTSIDPEMSARIANAYAEEFIAANLQRKFDSSAYARGFVAEQLATAKARLEGSDVALNNYARQNGLIRTGDAAAGDEQRGRGGGSVTTASLLQLNQAANTARAERITAQGRWQAISQGSGFGSPEVLANPTIQQLMGARAEVQAKLQQERARHLEDHPSVVQLKTQAGEIDRQLGSLVASVRSSVRTQYEAAANAERQLQQQVAALKAATLSEQDRSVQYSLLAREVDTNRTIYDGLLQRFKELNAAAGISASNLSIIDRADVPTTPSSPNLFKNLLLALAAGLGIAGLLVLFRDHFDDAIRVPEDVEAKLRLPLLGVVPKAEESPNVELGDPKSAISEAYSSLGGSLLYSTGEGLPETILVTSAQPGEGKSVTSLALASNLARIGRRVLLVDLDLRRPSLHRNIGSDNARGMTTLLTSHDPIESVLTETSQPGLAVITSGPVPPSPAELIGGARLQSLIDELAGRFDAVVFDSPPVLGLADAPLLAALVDGVVLVVEANRNRRGALKAALRRLRSMRPILLGAVLTKFDPKKAANRHSDYYGYDYYHYREDGATPARPKMFRARRR